MHLSIYLPQEGLQQEPPGSSYRLSFPAMVFLAGFSVTGTAREDALMTKGGLQAGQVLVLTKPLGTGTIMAAAMRGKARGRWVTGQAATVLCCRQINDWL